MIRPRYLSIALVIPLGVVLLVTRGISQGARPTEKVLSRKAPQVDFAQREKLAPPHIQLLLKNLRSEIGAKKLTFQVGYTTALDIPLEKLAGTRAPAPAQMREEARRINAHAAELLKIDVEARDAFAKANPGKLAELSIIRPTCAALSAFDWRREGKVTPVRNQDGCGSCWDFTAMGAYEGSYAIRNNALVDTSEQDILNCSGAGSCGGGWWMPAFDFLIHHGDAGEAADPYTANDKPCPAGLPTSFQAVAWGYVHVDGAIPTVAETKQALCQHGPLAVAVYVSPAFQAYTGGVFNEHDTSQGINHGVTLIGWDDSKNAWLIKNSWGTGWGETGGYGSERGYMWIAYDSNNIGDHAAWVQAKSNFYVLPPIYLERVRILKPIPPIIREPVRKP